MSHKLHSIKNYLQSVYSTSDNSSALLFFYENTRRFLLYCISNSWDIFTIKWRGVEKQDSEGARNIRQRVFTSLVFNKNNFLIFICTINFFLLLKDFQYFFKFLNIFFLVFFTNYLMFSLINYLLIKKYIFITIFTQPTYFPIFSQFMEWKHPHIKYTSKLYHDSLTHK